MKIKLSKSQWGMVALVLVLTILFAFINVKSSRIKSDGVYSISNSIELTKQTKYGYEYEYTFYTENGRLEKGKYFVNGLGFKDNLDIEKKYYVVYSKSKPKRNVLLLNKSCCDNNLLFEPIKSREWSIWDI